MPKANVGKPARGVPAALPRAAAGGGTADHAGDGRGMPRIPRTIFPWEKHGKTHRKVVIWLRNIGDFMGISWGLPWDGICVM